MQPETQRPAQLETRDGKTYARVRLNEQTHQAFTWPERCAQIGGFTCDTLLENEALKEYIGNGPSELANILNEDAIEAIADLVADASISAYDVGYHDAIRDLDLEIVYDDEPLPDA